MEVKPQETDVSQTALSHDCCLGLDKEASWQDLELIHKLPVECHGMHLWTQPLGKIASFRSA